MGSGKALVEAYARPAEKQRRPTLLATSDNGDGYPAPFCSQAPQIACRFRAGCRTKDCRGAEIVAAPFPCGPIGREFTIQLGLPGVMFSVGGGPGGVAKFGFVLGKKMSQGQKAGKFLNVDRG